MKINKDSLDFLSDLAQNNNRDWFNKHKDRYIEANNNIVAFADALIAEMNRHDHIETASGKDSIFRIYRDVRFSKDKTPYNTQWSGRLKRATKRLRGGYYFHIQHGASFAAGGFWGPDVNDIKRIHEDIDLNYERWEKLLSSRGITEAFGKMIGEQVASAPRGYAKDHPAINLLRHKQFLLKHTFTDADVLSPDFVYLLNDTYKCMRPFFDYMSEVLSVDANGVSIL